MTTFERAARMIREARKIIALTGAGISCESGIPDFRSPGGLWTRYDPFKYASLEAFMRDPSDFWFMARELVPLLEHADPNAAHAALRKLEEMGKLTAVITQNIDYLHQRAGSETVLEVHGTYHSGHCLKCHEGFELDAMKRLSHEQQEVPLCPLCNGVIKPDVVFFGEPLDSNMLGQSCEFATEADLMLVIGCSLEVYPAASLPQYTRRSGGKLIFFNVTPSPYDGMADLICLGPAGETLPRVIECLARQAVE
ncbi:MAG: SIR2 family NAD-dependent protein deacylase [Candidatus Geothermincolia bacterium]